MTALPLKPKLETEIREDLADRLRAMLGEELSPMLRSDLEAALAQLAAPLTPAGKLGFYDGLRQAGRALAYLGALATGNDAADFKRLGSQLEAWMSEARDYAVFTLSKVA